MIFSPKLPNVHYTPYGVDTTVFVPAKNPKHSPNGELILGWAGSKTNHPGKRGFEDYLLPALEGLQNIELRVAAREDRWRNQEEMVEFYQELDAYICCSRTEGGPLPVLEASSCGLPIISTPVGVVPELLSSGSNGITVERDIEQVRKAIIQLRDDRELRIQMGEEASDICNKLWSWDLQAKNYIPFFNACLES